MVAINITADTSLTCRVPVSAKIAGSTLVVECGTDVAVGSTLMYCYYAMDGCSYAVYDKAGYCISACSFDRVDDSGMRGGGFTIYDNMSRVVFSNTATLSKTIQLTVAQLVSDVSNIDELYQRLDIYDVDELYTQGIVNIYLDTKEHDGVAFTTDDTLTLDPVTGVLSVNTATEAEADNTLPITSAAVHTQIGNIEIILGTI